MQAKATQSVYFLIPRKCGYFKNAYPLISATAFLASVAGVSALFGFGATLSYAKKKDPTFFDKGVAMGPSLSESGAALALRALGWGTVYAVGGCGILFFSLWKLSGCNNVSILIGFLHQCRFEGCWFNLCFSVCF